MGKILPPTYFVLAIAGILALNGWFPGGRLLTFPWRWLGLVPFAGGAWLNVLADRQFQRHATTVKPFERSSKLVTAFPFSRTRNPMYLGLTLMLLGVAVWLGTVSPWLVVAAFAILIDRRFVRAEEEMLADAFGDQWRTYRARVRRWL